MCRTGNSVIQSFPSKRKYPVTFIRILDQHMTSASLTPLWRDYFEITKPRVVALMLLCALVGMLMARPELPTLSLILGTLTGIALVAGSAAAVNHLADARLDARMRRTQERPVATGRISHLAGSVFAAITGILGFVLLYTQVNALTAWLNLVSWLGYGIFYTLYLKHTTPQNIVIGGLFGAAPPLFGWTAVTGTLDAEALLLVLIIFVWTPPHFWALALDRRDEYAKADVPMLPNTHGEHFTRQQILLYTLLLVVASLLPYLTGMSGAVYLVSALALGAVFIGLAVKLLRGGSARTAMHTFRYSILYLGVLFLVMLFDHFLLR